MDHKQSWLIQCTHPDLFNLVIRALIRKQLLMARP